MVLTIFHLDSEKGMRGGEKQLLYLARGLEGRGHKSIVVCRENSLLASEAAKASLKTLELPMFGEWDLYSAWRLRQALKKYPSAIVHSHSAHTAMIAYWATRGTKVPRVAHRRINFPTSSHLSYRLKYGSADRVITVSQDLLHQMSRESNGAKNLTAIHDGIDLSAFKPTANKEAAKKALGFDPQTKILINVGALTPQKDHSTLLKAMAQIKPPSLIFDLPTSNFQLLIVGDGPLLSSLTQEARELNIKDRVEFLGFRTDIPQLLAASDIFVLSSIAEGFCNALLEAMAAGLPIIATAVGGNAEIVDDKKTGFVVPPKNPEALAQVLADLLRNPDQAKNLGLAGRAKVERFSVKNMVEEVENLYLSLEAK